ncbi:MAG: AAA family ATPase [Planctomycetes bacterium]|nr:AAA family ATPase [Planctomycetota bacterium]
MSATLAPPPKPGSLAEPSIGIPVQTKGATPFIPKPPRNFAEAGLDPGVVESLILKYLLGVGSAQGARIAEELCLPTQPVIDYLSMLKTQQIVVYTGTAHLDDFNYTLTDAGRDRARRFMLESLYVGPAPVTVEKYIEGIRAQTITTLTARKADLEKAFSDLLVSQEMFDVLGPAINSGRGMFLYGYPGNGKSSIAERITRCFGDNIYIPKCLIIDGMIMKVFDAANHEEIPRKKDSIFKADMIDDRWVQIRRPTIIVGGELTMESLEVQYNSTSKTCEAPVQLKSNCGTLVIDDFGRQRMKPIELLNRWIVPLEKRFDFLNMPNGKKVQVPFDQLIIFSTNLEPKDLCDDAFLRRIPYKINVPNPEELAFRNLFALVGPKMGFEMNDQTLKAIDYLVDTHYKKKDRPFRCCQPRDLLLQIRNRCLYMGKPLEVTPDLFDYAASVYFTIM